MKILCLLLFFINFAHYHLVVKSCDKNGTQIDAFYDSMERITSASNERFATIAQEIGVISNQMNSSASALFCYEGITQVLESGYQYEWSAKMLHSTSFLNSPPITSSLLAESLSSLGDFDQCLSAEMFLHFKPKYCLVHFLTPTFPYEFSFPPHQLSNYKEPSFISKLSQKWAVARNRLTMLAGVCLPSVCSSKQVQLLLEKYFHFYLKGVQLKVGHCQLKRSFSKTSTTFDLPYTLSKLFLQFLLFTSIFCTFILSYTKLLPKTKNSTFIFQLFRCFHIGKNLKSLFVSKQITAETKPKYDLRFLHGARLLLTIFTVGAHAFTAIPISFFSRVSHFRKFPSFFEESQDEYGLLDPMADRGGFLMDFFFLFSGFLTSYLLLSYREKGLTKSPPSFLLYSGLRWIRLAPSFAAFSALSIFAQKSMVSGPLAHQDLTEPHVKGCKVGAWLWGQLLLPVNNWWRMEESCGPHLWFVAVDYQLHLLFYPILLLLFWRWMRTAYLTIFSLIGVSLGGLLFIALTGIAEVPHFGFTHKFDKEIPFHNIRLLYTTPLIRILPYFTGVLIAVHLIESPKIVPKKTKYQELLFWTCVALIVTIIHSPTPSFITEAGPRFGTLYYLFLQAVHSLLAAFFFFSFLLSRGSFLKRLFYHPVMLPFSRLSYGMYLLNPLLIWTYYSSVRTPVDLSGGWRQFHFMVLIYFQSFACAMGLYVFVEAPFTALAKVVLNGPKK